MATPLNIEDPVAYELASQIALQTGKSVTQVIVDALRAEVSRIQRGRVDPDRVRATLARLHSFPVVENRNWDEVLYDEHGLPR